LQQPQRLARAAQAARVRLQLGQPGRETRPRHGRVEVGGHRAGGPAIEVERPVRVAAGREQQLRPADRGVPRVLVEVDPSAGDERERRPHLLLRRALERPDPIPQRPPRHA